MGSMSIWHWAIVAVIVLLLFGGRGKLSAFVALNFLNAFFYTLSYPFTDAAGRQNVKLWLRRFSLSLPYWVKVIPKFPRGFANRKEGLIYAAARPLFFDNKS